MQRVATRCEASRSPLSDEIKVKYQVRTHKKIKYNNSKWDRGFPHIEVDGRVLYFNNVEGISSQFSYEIVTWVQVADHGKGPITIVKTCELDKRLRQNYKNAMQIFIIPHKYLTLRTFLTTSSIKLNLNLKYKV